MICKFTTYLLLLQAFFSFLRMKNEVKVNSFRAWLLAARPKTLTGAAVPVMVALALAWHDMHTAGMQIYSNEWKWLPALLCLLFAFIMQIDANFVNDYFDFKRGNDDENRLGPMRACAMGWVTPKAMKRALVLTTSLGCLVGLPLVWYGGWSMVVVGILCVLFCFLYTTRLSYVGMGDVLVLVFFGLVPVCCTYFLQTGLITLTVFLASLGCGVAIDTLLLVNNYRDIDGDRQAGKQTLVVLAGKAWGLRLYLGCGLLATLLACAVLVMQAGQADGISVRTVLWLLPMAIYLFVHLKTYLRMKRIDHGRELNAVLGETARNIFLYGLLFSLCILLST